jgi:hypothetical protein
LWIIPCAWFSFRFHGRTTQTKPSNCRVPPPFFVRLDGFPAGLYTVCADWQLTPQLRTFQPFSWYRSNRRVELCTASICSAASYMLRRLSIDWDRLCAIPWHGLSLRSKSKPMSCSCLIRKRFVQWTLFPVPGVRRAVEFPTPDEVVLSKLLPSNTFLIFVVMLIVHQHYSPISISVAT